jgi:carboxymethylenebutenolidase
MLELGSARASLTRPARGNGVGVILYPTIFGLNKAIAGFASNLSEAGFTVAIWDPYDGETLSSNIVAVVARSKQIEDDRCVESLQAITNYLRSLGLGRIGGVGWCFGGRIPLLHAGRDARVTALSSYNPTILPPEPVEVAGVGKICRSDCPGQTMDECKLAEGIEGPVQVTRPGHDFTQPPQYRRIVDTLFARTFPTFYEYYPLVGHGFSFTPGDANEAAQRYAWRNTHQLLDSLVEP